MRNFVSLFLVLFFSCSLFGQDEGYKNERIQKGLSQGLNYLAITSGYNPHEGEFLISIYEAQTLTDQVVGGRCYSYNSNELSKNEFMFGFFANIYLGKYQIKPVVSAKGELLFIPERKFEDANGTSEKIPSFFGVKTSVSPGISYLVSETINIQVYAQFSYLPFTNREDIMTSSFLPRFEFAFMF